MNSHHLTLCALAYEAEQHRLGNFISNEEARQRVKKMTEQEIEQITCPQAPHTISDLGCSQ